MVLPNKKLNGIFLIILGLGINIHTINAQDDSLAGSFLSGKCVVV